MVVQMNIRILNAQDAERYWELRLRGLQESPEAFATTYEEAVARPNPIEGMAQRLEGDNGFTLGAFDEEGRLLGNVTFMREAYTKMQHRGSVVAVYVAPEARGKQVARKLMEELIERARQIAGMEQLHLAVTATNEPARRLYLSLGFEIYGLEKNALKHNGVGNDDELMMLVL